MEFTDKDRQFIIKLAKGLELLSKEVDKLKKPVLSDVHVTPEGEAVELPMRQGIQLNFRDKMGNPLAQKILIESLYKILNEMCQKHGIESLEIKIDNRTK